MLWTRLGVTEFVVVLRVAKRDIPTPRPLLNNQADASFLTMCPSFHSSTHSETAVLSNSSPLLMRGIRRTLRLLEGHSSTRPSAALG